MSVKENPDRKKIKFCRGSKIWFWSKFWHEPKIWHGSKDPNVHMQTLIVVGVFMIVEALTFSSFIRSDQKVTPYQLVFFLVMTLKSDFSLIGTGKITLKGSMNTANF